MDILYGFKKNDMTALKSAVEKELVIQFQLRNSSFRCDEYFLYRNESRSVELIIQLNCYDEIDQEYQEDFPEYPVLLYLSAVNDEARRLDSLLLKKIEGLVRLRAKEYT
jgi:hypothetical protein